ncbi:unnamed protein product [Ranitomeya imitator]|uniref:Uncharacterized protein n=1 Tax=Ranitomeya imitator TaxID=111125 RepID=A0ABN9M243_9NEOB|nr:unnamed protein product [Ranitomeya imitator]
MEQQKQKLQKVFLIVIYQLVDEVLTGGVVSFLHSIGAMKNYNKYILNRIPDMYAEEQIIWCLNQVADLLMSEFRPQELTPSELQAKALDVLKNKVQGFVTNFWVKFGLNENNLKASHQALQDRLANKETLYNLHQDNQKAQSCPEEKRGWKPKLQKKGETKVAELARLLRANSANGKKVTQSS